MTRPRSGGFLARSATALAIVLVAWPGAASWAQAPGPGPRGAPPARPGDPPPGAPADSAAAADSTAADSAAVPFQPFRPDSTIGHLADFRLARSADVETLPFGTPDDPWVPPGLQTLADRLRLSPGVRTRELSNGPTVEAVELRGGGTGRTEIVLGSRSLGAPGTSGPFSHEAFLSEISAARVLRGGGAALYGPDAVSGAVVLSPAMPIVDELATRAFGEEGVDGYQRAGFQAARYWGSDGGFFLTTESRRVDGFFPGTKEVDRHFAARVVGHLRGGFQSEAGYRHYRGDGRDNGFSAATVGSILTKRSDWHANLFRSFAPGRGTLAELQYRDERLENVGVDSTRTRDFKAPTLRLTTDLPDWGGLRWTARAEGSRWRIQEEGAGVDTFWRAAAALRTTLAVGSGGGLTGTVRVDTEESRRDALQARAEGWWTAGPVRPFAVASRNERIPERGAAGDANEIHESAEVGAVVSSGAFRFRTVAFATDITDRRRDATFEEIRSRVAVLDAPVGDATVRGATAGVETGFFRFPGAGFLGDASIRTSFTWQDARDTATDGRLPGRPERTWTGEGSLERRFFQEQLLARVHGRLTHWGHRRDDTGARVIDLWMTDVLLEGEVGDAVFFVRFHDPLGRADEVEPGIRFPGFSRTYGVSWRFRG